MEHTLEVFSGETLVFHSDGRWLYPLFELERFVESAGCDPAGLTVRDKIIGKAAALLLIRLGVGYVKAGLISIPGKEALEKHGVAHEYDRLVDRIACRTEELLSCEDDPEKAYAMLKERAKISDVPGNSEGDT